MHLIGVEGMPRRVADYADAVRDLEPVHLAGVVRARALSTLVFVYNMVASWRGGAARRRQPVARAHARVAGLLAAADLQLRRRSRPSSAARTSTACPGAVHGIFKPRRRGAADAGGRAAPPTERAGAQRMSDDPRRRQRDARRAARCSTPIKRARGRAATSRVVVVRPAQTSPQHGNVIYDEAVLRRRAGAHRPRARASCASTGIEAIGEVGDPDPYTADDGRRRASTGPTRSSSRRSPATSSGWLRRDLIERIERGDRPAGRARRRRPRRRGPARSTSRSSSPTRPRRRRAARARSKAHGRARAPHRFIVVVPAGGRRGPRRRARRASAWRSCSTALRAEGLDRRRHDRRPRPLHGDR